MSDLTRILMQIDSGDRLAAEQLLPLVYDELRRMAAAKLATERPGQTLQATALVHEAYLRLVGPDNAQQWDSRHHFFAAAAEAMRRILVDSARRKQSSKRAGDRDKVQLDFDPAESFGDTQSEDLLALDSALQQLEQLDPAKAEVVKLRYFAGLSIDETARCLDISPATVKRYWVYARSWLYGQIREH